jgi:hypothetical protein
MTTTIARTLRLLAAAVTARRRAVHRCRGPRRRR